MTDFGYPDFRRIASKALAQRAESVDGSRKVGAAAQRAYDDLTRVAAPLIGRVGAEALTGRTLFLLQTQYRWLALTREPGQWTGPFEQIIFALKHQTPAVGMEAAAAVLATFAGLIATLIGEPLATRLLQEAWPDAFADGSSKEK